MSQLNKVDAANSGYSSYTSLSKEDIVQVMSKLEIYEGYLRKKDSQVEAQEPTAEHKNEESAVNNNGAIAIPPLADDEASTPKMNKLQQNSSVLKSTPPAFIICQSKDESYLNILEHEGVMLSLSYLKGTYVTSKPTGYTNLAVSAAFLASKRLP